MPGKNAAHGQAGALQKMTAPKIRSLKGKQKIVMVTAYDCPSARLVDEAVDVILVGDSLGNVVLGYENTLPVTMEEMLHHCKAVARGAKKALIVGDMPFLSYQAEPADAVRNAGRFLKEGNAQAVKLEGGSEVAEHVKAVLKAGIPVMGHLGLTPQSLHQFGGHKVQGREAAQRKRILEDARALEDAGCFALVLECIPQSLAKEVTAAIGIPTIGIGAGPDCDGQVLVFHDLIGYNENNFKFLKRYAEVGCDIKQAVETYAKEVREKKFPSREQGFD